jgi:uncharacterized protein (DUF1330 family)
MRWRKPVAAYFIFDEEVTDPATFEQYRAKAIPTIAQYGGKVISATTDTEPCEGSWSPKVLVILEFSSVETAKRWYHSPEYADARPLRERSATCNVVLAPGI